jgi:glycerate 2-kinase
MSFPSGRSAPALEMRAAAGGFFNVALADANIAKAFNRHVECERGVLRIFEDLHHLDAFNRVFVVAIGKAAHSLVEALESRAGSRFEGIVASSVAPAAQTRGFRYFLSGHPTPNSESLRAASAMLKSVSGLGAQSLVIYLLSGGGSSMAEKPVDDEISLDDIATTYRALVLSGAPIAEINALRKHLSAIKGGRLAAAAYPARQVSLLVSDVPDNTPDALASGPTMPDSTTIEDCYGIVAKHGLMEQLPASVRALFARRTLEETPKFDHEAFVHSRWWTLLSNTTAVQAAVAEAKQAGFSIEVDNNCDDWDYAPAADYLFGRLRELRNRSERVCLISGGEVTVKVTGNGTGGRNQQFALACAEKIAGQNVTVLSAGTDGIDGNSPAAGAIADGTTVERAQALGLDAATHLGRFDAYSFFHALGDDIVTGPTGNNLRDLRILLAY